MTHVTCRLTAKNRDQLQNPTLGNRVRATFLLLHRPTRVSVVMLSVATCYLYAGGRLWWRRTMLDNHGGVDVDIGNDQITWV